MRTVKNKKTRELRRRQDQRLHARRKQRRRLLPKKGTKLTLEGLSFGRKTFECLEDATVVCRTIKVKVAPL